MEETKVSHRFNEMSMSINQSIMNSWLLRIKARKRTILVY